MYGALPSYITLSWLSFLYAYYLHNDLLSIHWLGAPLTHWGRVTHICVSKLTISGSDNGLSPGRRQAIIWTNAGILLIRTLGTHFSEILGLMHSFSFKKKNLKMSSAKGRLFSLGLNELNETSEVSGLLFDIILFHSRTPMADTCKTQVGFH